MSDDDPGVSVFIWYQNPSSTCTPWGGSCAAGESLTLTARSFNYDFACGPHTFVWNFGDGSTASGPIVTHTYNVPGYYTAQLAVTNSTQAVLLTQVINVSGPQPPPPKTCGTMAAGINTFISFHDQNSSCSEVNPNCQVTTPIVFTAKSSGDYDFSCAHHVFTWDFGDGVTASGMTVTRAYAGPGNYVVTCSVSSPSTGVTLTATVHVALSTVPHCGPIAITPTTLPVTSAGTAFDATLRPSGGAAPYSIFIVNGTLPPGLTFWVDNISGIATTPGSYGFNVYAVDSRGCGSVIPYTIVVEAPPSGSRRRATRP